MLWCVLARVCLSGIVLVCVLVCARFSVSLVVARFSVSLVC